MSVNSAWKESMIVSYGCQNFIPARGFFPVLTDYVNLVVNFVLFVEM